MVPYFLYLIQHAPKHIVKRFYACPYLSLLFTLISDQRLRVSNLLSMSLAALLQTITKQQSIVIPAVRACVRAYVCVYK